jgi:hypothetical protein
VRDANRFFLLFCLLKWFFLLFVSSCFHWYLTASASTPSRKNGLILTVSKFGFALYTLLQSTHDGHFVFIPDSVGGVFNWGRPVALVSVSEDGKSLPVPYVYQDVVAESLGKAGYKASHIVKINGQDATTYLKNWAQYGSLQDRDALYNVVFYQLAQVSLGTTASAMGTFTGGGRGRWVYPGPTTKLTFANGTSVTYTNFARILTPFTGVHSGEDLYRLKFAIPASPSASPAATSSASASPTSTPTATSTPVPTPTPAPGYPPPVIRQINNLIAGYYIDAPGYEDVAVLAVPSFVGSSSAEISFQRTGQKFLAAARAAGKTKLIIDVSANGGGTILQGYDLFKQLFPMLEPYAAADRFRAFESTNLIGEIFSQISGTVPRTLDQSNDTLVEIEGDIVSSVFNYRTDETTDGKPFRSWKQKFGPNHIHNDNFTNLFRWNLSDVLTPYNSGGIYVTGYGPNQTQLVQPFANGNVVVMTDGYCASTCTIFSELMQKVAGVKYIAMGGRPLPGITQAIGGVKGTNDLPWDYIQYIAQLAIADSPPSQQARLNKTELGDYYSNIPFERAANNTAYNVNFRDGIRKGDPTNTPLQFVYEAADCRILYTKAMTVDATAQWKAVADSTWGKKTACIAGSAAYGRHYQTRAEVHPDAHISMKREAADDNYPLDIYTDLAGLSFTADGWMMP